MRVFGKTSHHLLLVAALVFGGLFLWEVFLNLRYLREGRPVRAKVTYPSKGLILAAYEGQTIRVRRPTFAFYRAGQEIEVLWRPKAVRPGAFIQRENAREAAPWRMWQRGGIYLLTTLGILILYCLPWVFPAVRTGLAIEVGQKSAK